MHKNNKRRGRPRTIRPIIDSGTEEFQTKRRALAHENPALAESLLGILYARQLISGPLYEAGRFFGELGYRFEPCLGHKFRPSSSLRTHESSPLVWSNHQIEKRTRAWVSSLMALKQAGDGPYKTVLSVVFYDQDLYTAPVLKGAVPFLEPLRKGLEVLDAWFRGVRREVQRCVVIPEFRNAYE